MGCRYRPDQIPNDISVIWEKTHKIYDEILFPEEMGNISIYTEMGRFMLATYDALITKVNHEKHIYKEYIGVYSRAANPMRLAIYWAYHHITVLGKENDICDHVYDVTGFLCEKCDKCYR